MSTAEMTPLQAKAYLIQCIVEEAQLDNRPLSERETKLLRFTESDPTEDFSDLGSDVDETFEHCITALLRQRYKRSRSENKAEAAMIRRAVKVLGTEDHYLSVMVEPAIDFTKDLSVKDSIWILLALLGVILIAAKIISRLLL